MIKYIIACPIINIYKLPKNNSAIDICYNYKELIITGGLPFKGEDGLYWICFIYKNGLLRYLPYIDKKKRKYVIKFDPYTEKIIKEIKINYFNKKKSKKKHREVKNKLINIKNNFNKINEETFLNKVDIFLEIKNIYFESENNLQYLYEKIKNIIFNSKKFIKKIAKIISSYIEYIQNNENILNIVPLQIQNNSIIDSFTEKPLLDSNKKNCYEPHNKFSKDNMRKRAKFLTIKIIKKLLNSKIEEIDILKQNFSQPKLFELKQDSMNLTKDYYLKLLNRTFREIFSSDIKKTKKSKYENDEKHNKKLIDKIYEIYEKGNKDKIIKDLIDFFEMKFKKFFDILNNNILNEVIDNNDFYLILKNDFFPTLEEYLKNESKENENEYIIELKN